MRISSRFFLAAPTQKLIYYASQARFGYCKSVVRMQCTSLRDLPRFRFIGLLLTKFVIIHKTLDLFMGLTSLLRRDLKLLQFYIFLVM